MVASIQLPIPNLTIDPQIEKNPSLLLDVISASGCIPQVFQDRTKDYGFSWNWKPADSHGLQLFLDARGLESHAQTGYRPLDLADSLQLKRKLLELKGDLLGQETRRSLIELRDILNLSDSADADVIREE